MGAWAIGWTLSASHDSGVGEDGTCAARRGLSLPSLSLAGVNQSSALRLLPSTHDLQYQPTQRFHSSPLPTPAEPASTMSTSKQTTDLSTANFTAIFDAASNEYKTLTKQDLETHPFAAAFEISNSPDSVMNAFRKQAQAFDKFRKGDDKLMAWLTPIVNILFTFSGTLGEGIGLVSIRSFYDIAAL
jgi:hypothetical protein